MKKYVTVLMFFVLPNVTYASLDNVYIGAKSGWSYFGSGCEIHRVYCNKHSLGVGLFAGYQFNEWLAIEGGYNYFGKAKASYPALENRYVNADYEADVQGIDLSLKANYEINDKNSVFFKVGALYWTADKQGKEVSFNVNTDDSDLSLALGVGYQFAMNEKINFRLEYQWFDNVGGRNTRGSDLSFLTMGFDFGVFRNTHLIDFDSSLSGRDFVGSNLQGE